MRVQARHIDVVADLFAVVHARITDLEAVVEQIFTELVGGGNIEAALVFLIASFLAGGINFSVFGGTQPETFVIPKLTVIRRRGVLTFFKLLVAPSNAVFASLISFLAPHQALIQLGLAIIGRRLLAAIELIIAPSHTLGIFLIPFLAPQETGIQYLLTFVRWRLLALFELDIASLDAFIVSLTVVVLA